MVSGYQDVSAVIICGQIIFSHSPIPVSTPTRPAELGKIKSVSELKGCSLHNMPMYQSSGI